MNTIKTAVVLGLGATGEAVSQLLHSRGARVRILESSSGPGVCARAEQLGAIGIESLTGIKDLSREHLVFQPGGVNADICVVSPGVPADSPWISAVQRLGIPPVSELDAAQYWCPCPVVAVTGSNGKSTLVKLLSDTLHNLGFAAQPCGNYGKPLSAVAAEAGENDRPVVEVSSFQMEWSSKFHPQTAVLLNLQPNHLDRHGSMEVYAGLKARLFSNMSVKDIAVVHEEQAGLVRSLNGHVRMVEIGAGRSSGYYYEKGYVKGGGCRVSLAGTYFDNPVLGLSAAAALAVVRENGWEVKALEKAAREFKPLRFRMEPAGEINGVRYVNNSKATTLSAVEASLKMVDGPVRLIAGGLLKEKDLSWIKKILEKRVSGAYVYGNAGSKLSEAWADCVKCRVFDRLKEALLAAAGEAAEGDVILLSPGCTSFDQYSSYADRGEDFNNILNELRRVSG